jgi:hypothetical protein
MVVKTAVTLELKGMTSMRIAAILACGALAACTSGAVTVPSDDVIVEVPYSGSASTTGGPDSFTSTIGAAIDEGGNPVAPSPTGTGPGLDQDRINLMQWTLEQQKIDAAKAQRDLDAARSKLVVVQPGSVPRDDGVNVALYAMQSTNAVGQKVYRRSVGARVTGVGSCGRYGTPDAAQRAFLGAGGPESDRLGLDPDGDGFACDFDPAVYRALN